MSWLVTYLVACALAMLALALLGWVSLRTKETQTITLGDLLVGVVLSLIPGVNVMVALFVFGGMLHEFAPKIVLFGKKD